MGFPRRSCTHISGRRAAAANSRAEMCYPPGVLPLLVVPDNGGDLGLAQVAVSTPVCRGVVIHYHPFQVGRLEGRVLKARPTASSPAAWWGVRISGQVTPPRRAAADQRA